MTLPLNEIICGDCREELTLLPAGCIHCVVTSVPYWGLRDYGIKPTVWGGNADCEHEWHDKTSQGQFCQHCEAWLGCYGLEPTPELYVEHSIEVFRAVRRVLREDGTLWLNLGDSYCGGGRGGNPKESPYRKQATNVGSVVGVTKNPWPIPHGLKPKDLLGMPWRVAFALQADGWYLRQDIIWHKPNPMPESVTDRCTKAHEYIFLLTKSAHYFYDMEAIKEISTFNPTDWNNDETPKRSSKVRGEFGGKGQTALPGREPFRAIAANRNKRSVWTVPTAPFKDAHFATFPPELIRPCIRAGTSQKGCCPQCGTPWVRILERKRVATRPGQKTKIYKTPDGWDTTKGKGGHGSFHKDGREKGYTDYEDKKAIVHRVHHRMEVGNGDPQRHVTEAQTVGWQPSCACNAGEPVPCIVLDPFAGSGTTGYVAAQERRDYILCDINPDYVAMARARLSHVETGVPLKERRAGQTGLFDG